MKHHDKNNKGRLGILAQHEAGFEPSPAFVMLTGVRKRLLPLTKREGSDSVISNNFFDKNHSQLTTHHSLISDTVFSRFTSHFSRKRTAFTLAEILITLGIIGVVVAMTLPSLIANYQKKVTATKLHQAYDFLQQVFVNAQAEYGDLDTWDCFRPHTCSVETFANTYIVPYIKDAELETYPNLLVAGYKNYPKQLNGNSTLASVKEIIHTKQNYIYMIYFYDTQDNNRRIFNIAIDINGKNKPNILGKDIFITTTGHNLDSNNHYKLQMYNYNSYKKETILKQTCNKTLNSESCGALIEMDNWEISKDYPW